MVKENAENTLKTVQKMLEDNTSKTGNDKDKLHMVDLKNKIRRTIKGFNQIMMIKGRNMQT